jgi:hypothetical protein
MALVAEIFNLLDNTFVDFDGWYGDQCVDWVQIINKLYGASPLSGQNASDIWNTYPQANYTRIVNGPNNFPNEGDIPIWKPNVPGITGPAGHIAVARKGCTGMILLTKDQNYPTGSRIHDVQHTYAGVLGWLHKK